MNKKVIKEIKENVNRHPGRPLTVNEAKLQLSVGLSIEVYISYKNKWDIITDKNYIFSKYDEYFRVPEAENEFIRDLQDDIRELKEQIKFLQEYNERQICQL